MRAIRNLIFRDFKPRNELFLKYHRTLKTCSSKRDNKNEQYKDSYYKKAAYLGIAGISSFLALKQYYLSVEAKLRPEEKDEGLAIKTPGEPVFTREDVAKHNDFSTGIWITYHGNVYDITNFVRHHPGGSHTIMMGAGGDVGPFWDTYSFHQEEEVQRLLSTYKIGILTKEDAEAISSQNEINDGPYANDPKRSILLETHTKEPCNAETPSKLLVSSYYTPADIFFVRNHLPVPEVDPKDYKLSICLGSDGDHENQTLITEFSLDELKNKFKPHSIDCIIQCSGNRRSDLKKIKEIKGLGWKTGAMGNAKWTGVRLVDLLDSLGLKHSDSVKHIQLEGLDCDMTGQAYGASISADVAFDPAKEVLLAYEMNGQPLSRDHGFPLRFIAPGITGARNVKWLSKIILSHEESNSHWQRKDYKSFSPNIDMFNLDYNQSVSIQEMPVQSAICDPTDMDDVLVEKNSKTIPVKGYAYSGGGKMIIRVDISIDGGKNWITADLLDQPKNSDGTPDYSNRNHVWTWTRWKVDVPIEDTCKEMEIICRAFDSAYNGQPERPETIWNVRGVVNNSWHKCRINIRRQE